MSNSLTRQITRLLPKALAKKLPRNIAVVLISAKTSRVLNLVYRGKNKSANVLSFYYNRRYGEILVSKDVVRAEAQKAGNSYKYQFAWMVLHGMLHLAGWHHEDSGAIAGRAARLEKRLLKRISSSIKNFKSQITNSKQYLNSNS